MPLAPLVAYALSHKITMSPRLSASSLYLWDMSTAVSFMLSRIRCGLYSLSKNRIRNMSSSRTRTPSPFRVLILGGSYGGLSAALNLLDLSQHKAPRCGKQIGETEGSDLVRPPNTNIDITIVDERDGFCKCRYSRPRMGLVTDCMQTISLARPWPWPRKATWRSSG